MKNTEKGLGAGGESPRDLREHIKKRNISHWTPRKEGKQLVQKIDLKRKLPKFVGRHTDSRSSTILNKQQIQRQP